MGHLKSEVEEINLKMAQAPQQEMKSNDPSTIDQVLSTMSLFVEKADAAKYQCAICLNLCQNAVESGCSNGHVFCNSCLMMWFDTSNNRRCPADRQQSNQVTKSAFVDRQIRQSKIKWLHSNHNNSSNDNGNSSQYCKWEGCVSEIESHLLNDCLFAKLKCDYCSKKFTKHQLSSHLKSHINELNAENNKFRSLITNAGWTQRDVQAIICMRKHCIEASIVRFAIHICTVLSVCCKSCTRAI